MKKKSFGIFLTVLFGLSLTTGQSSYSQDTNRIILEAVITGLEYRDLYNNSNSIISRQDSVIGFQSLQIDALRNAYRIREGINRMNIEQLTEDLREANKTSWVTYALLVLSSIGAGYVLQDVILK